MRARFLLGPAGSGKTWRCLHEVRQGLREAPDGLPLLFLAPKQATFQIERQLLADPELPGYTRLQVLSFERLANLVLETGAARPRLLDEEGRVMVLRALLAGCHGKLRVFRAAARLPGFARQLSLQLRELEQHRLGAGRLTRAAEKMGSTPALADKLHDLALLLNAYREWLKERELEDGASLLDLAVAALRGPRHPAGDLFELARERERAGVAYGGLWLDGFAEMTPQELNLLAAIIPRCTQATLAFCLPAEPSETWSRFSPWTLVGQTWNALRSRLETLPGVECSVEHLTGKDHPARFSGSPALAHLERHWSQPVALPAETAIGNAVRVVLCPHPEAEAKVAAREILAHARAGGRFRDAAVLVRSLDTYHDVLRRVFRSFGIPFFLDRRESVAHHPLAELARYSVRVTAFDWEQADWFGIMKTGLLPAGGEELDELENEALARGWSGLAWRRPFAAPELGWRGRDLERVRQRIVPPFERFGGRLGQEPTGLQLAGALRDLFTELRVEEQLEEWAMPERFGNAVRGLPAIHRAVWEQVNLWLDNVALAFPKEPLSLRLWLPILEAGLGGLTVGVVPPALDQVLVGAVDRSRNPDLQLAIVLGLNEGMFPAPPRVAGLLDERDRDELEHHNLSLGPNRLLQLAHERYLAYIACTRARSRLVVTAAERDENDRVLNPSPLLGRIERMLPGLGIERVESSVDWRLAVHPSELAVAWLQARRAAAGGLPAAEPLPRPALAEDQVPWEALAEYGGPDSLSPAVARRLYGPVLRTSVSALEHYAACPFKFLVHSGLHAEERRFFEIDARQRGSFQHEVLARFHRELEAQGKRWRDLDGAEARRRVEAIARDVGTEFGEGRFRADARARFTTSELAARLADYVETAVVWMNTYAFDPWQVELGFGGEGEALPAWEIDLGSGRRLAFRGKIDRVDLATEAEAAPCFAVVLDYKSSQKKIDPLLLEHGIQLQLMAYLAALKRILSGHPRFCGKHLVPAGVFYVNLRGASKLAPNRRQVLGRETAAKQEAYQHRGRFRFEALPRLDQAYRGGGSSQFAYRLKKNGLPAARAGDLLTGGEFDRWVDRIEAQLRQMGQEIYAGATAIDPYRKGREIACRHCEYQAICRIDPWTHTYRVLKGSSSGPGDESRA